MTNKSISMVAHVLHVRPYTDSRCLVELLCENDTRITAVARAKKLKKNQRTASYPFQPLSVLHIQGYFSASLFSLVSHELLTQPQLHTGRVAFCGLYLNELVVRMVPGGDEVQGLFTLYQKCLTELIQISAANNVGQADLEPPLRVFEFSFFEKLGYGIDFCNSVDGDAISESGYYQYLPGEGFLTTTTPQGIRGQQLLDIARKDFCSPESRKAAKYLARRLVDEHLDGRPLKSRELFDVRLPLETL